MNQTSKVLGVTAVIPVKNEAGGIEKIVKETKGYCDEVLVIDGHSSDDTVELAKKAGAQVWQDNGKGKGAAYKLGLEKAAGAIVVFMDGDGSHTPEDIPKIIKPILRGEAKLVIASRHKGGSDEWNGDLNTYLRHLGSGFLSVCINYRWGLNITDCLNGFRAIEREAALKVSFKADDFDIEQHMIVACARKRYPITEVGSHEYCRQWGTSKLPTFKKAYLFFWRLFLDLLPEIHSKK